MTSTAHRLGMTQSNFVNPNGLPADGQITSARDLAILARALIREFPEYDFLLAHPGDQVRPRVVRNYNTLLGRYPGADGMKTGFICASGFNLVATATRNGKRLIAVVLGAPSSAARAVKAAELLESGFSAESAVVAHAGARDGRQPHADQRRSAQSARSDVRPASQEAAGGRGGGSGRRQRRRTERLVLDAAVGPCARPARKAPRSSPTKESRASGGRSIPGRRATSRNWRASRRSPPQPTTRKEGQGRPRQPSQLARAPRMASPQGGRRELRPHGPRCRPRRLRVARRLNSGPKRPPLHRKSGTRQNKPRNRPSTASPCPRLASGTTKPTIGHSGSRAKRGCPESITADREYGFRARRQGPAPGMTTVDMGLLARYERSGQFAMRSRASVTSCNSSKRQAGHHVAHDEAVARSRRARRDRCRRA